MEYFWTHRDNIPEGMGFGQFSLSHFIWLGLVVLLVFAITKGYKNSDRSVRIRLRRFIAGFLMISELFKLFFVIRDGVDVTQYLPLEICSFAAYSIVLDSIFPDNQVFPELLVIMFLPAAIMALLFPTVTPLPAINFFTIHQFVYHGLIVSYIVARFASGEVTIDYPGVWKSIFKILAIAAVVYIIDITFNKTYMFLTDPYGNPLLSLVWNITGGGIKYTLGLVVFVIVVVHFFFLVFKGIEKMFKLNHINKTA